MQWLWFWFMCVCTVLCWAMYAAFFFSICPITFPGFSFTSSKKNPVPDIQRIADLFAEILCSTITHLHIHIITWAIPMFITPNHLCTFLLTHSAHRLICLLGAKFFFRDRARARCFVSFLSFFLLPWIFFRCFKFVSTLVIIVHKRAVGNNFNIAN